jgi:hypothetical protein
MTTSLTSQISSPVSQVPIPSYGLPISQLQSGRGICTLNHSKVGQLQFRTNPNEITWDYELITHTEQTYGGRVVQILGVKMDNLKVKVDCGQGGWAYAMYVVQFMRDLMVQQRGGEAATFTYTTRNWTLKCFAQDVPFHDSVQETVRELTLNFKIQEDISGVQTSASLDAALQALQDGIGFVANAFNNAGLVGTTDNGAGGGGPATALETTTNPILPTAATGPTDIGVPGLGNITNALGGLIPGA